MNRRTVIPVIEGIFSVKAVVTVGLVADVEGVNRGGCCCGACR